MPPSSAEFRTMPPGVTSPSGDQIVHIMPAGQGAAVVIQAGNSTPFRRARCNPPSPLTPPGSSPNVDPISQWRRHKISTPHRVRSYGSASRRTNDEDDEEEDIDDATSFSSMRVVRDQDKPSRKRVSAWRNSVLRRKREQLALAMATGQWDALTPSSRAASLLDEVGNQYKTSTSSDTSAVSRVLPFIPDVLPKSDRAGVCSLRSTGPCTKVQEKQERQESKGKTNQNFCYFGKKENFDPTLTSIAESLSFFNLGSISSCARPRTTNQLVSSGKQPAQQDNIMASFDSKSAASVLARWTCQEERQESNVMDTDIVVRSLDELEENRKEANDVHSEEALDKKEGRKKSSQRSQVALEVIKLRKELKRLKQMVQTKKTKKEQRDRELIAVASSLSAPSTSGGNHRGISGISSKGSDVDGDMPAKNAADVKYSSRTGAVSVSTTAPYNSSRVRFTEPLVTQVSYRPYTEPEEIEKLYFIEEELNELEWDRQTVADDQYEVVMTSPTSSTIDVKVAHQKRRLLALHPHEGLPHSLSDLSVY